MSVLIKFDQTSKVATTFTLVDNTTEQTVFEILNPSRTIYRFNCKLDIDSITKNNFRIRVYYKIDNSNYRLYQTQTFSPTDSVCFIPQFNESFDIKITAQSSITEGASRSIPYVYYMEHL